MPQYDIVGTRLCRFGDKQLVSRALASRMERVCRGYPQVHHG